MSDTGQAYWKRQHIAAELERKIDSLKDNMGDFPPDTEFVVTLPLETAQEIYAELTKSATELIHEQQAYLLGLDDLQKRTKLYSSLQGFLEVMGDTLDTLLNRKEDTKEE